MSLHCFVRYLFRLCLLLYCFCAPRIPFSVCRFRSCSCIVSSNSLSPSTTVWGRAPCPCHSTRRTPHRPARGAVVAVVAAVVAGPPLWWLPLPPVVPVIKPLCLATGAHWPTSWGLRAAAPWPKTAPIHFCCSLSQIMGPHSPAWYMRGPCAENMLAMYPSPVGPPPGPNGKFAHVELETQRPIKVAVYNPVHKRVCV